MMKASKSTKLVFTQEHGYTSISKADAKKLHAQGVTNLYVAPNKVNLEHGGGMYFKKIPVNKDFDSFVSMYSYDIQYSGLGTSVKYFVRNW